MNDEGGIDEEWSESDSNAHDGERYIMRTLLTSISLFFRVYSVRETSASF